MSQPTFNLAATTNTQTEILWTALSGSSTGGQSVLIDAYDLQQYDSSLTTWFTIQNSTSLSFVQTGLVGGRFYYFKVRAFNKYGSGEFSSVASVFTG